MSARGRRILVVDDNVDSADMLEMLLKQMGADVRVAADGRSAIDTLKSYRPSVVFLDIDLPDMDGHEVARRMRRNLSGGGLTLIALTGWSGQEDIRRSKAAGIDHHFVKPLDVVVLAQVLEALPPTNLTG
jgi:CheY-like chemotaxis protein